MAISNAQQAKQLLALGGRIGFQGGGKDMGQEPDSQGNVGGGFGDNRDRGRERSMQAAQARADYKSDLGDFGDPDPFVDKPLNERDTITSYADNLRANLRANPFSLFTAPFRTAYQTNKARDMLGLTNETDDDDSDQREGGDDRPYFQKLGFPTEAAYLASLRQPVSMSGVPAATTPTQSMDLNRIAYRLMADGGFIDEEDEPRQAYGLGSIVRKITRPIKKVVKKATKTVKKVTKSPLGRLAIAIAAPYALGPAFGTGVMGSLSAAQKAALISGATTGITQLASGEDLDLKDIAVSAALSGGISKLTTPAVGVDGKAFNAARTSAGQQTLDPSTLASRARVASDVTPKNTSFLRDSFMGSRGKNIVDAVSTPATESTGILQTIKDLGTKVKDSKLTDILLRTDEGKISPMKSILLASALSGVLAKKDQEPEEFTDQERGEGIDIAAIRRRPFNFIAPRFAGSQFDFYDTAAADGGRIGYQKGSKEPVAKKTMPLLDMGGMEKDYREEGGFVPIGRMEKADDVPARLSKNEFVFTADAVRNAGDGNVDKGAEVMYNMMKNLEAGGDVSKESQGLKGARRMFQTSQRLEEVL